MGSRQNCKTTAINLLSIVLSFMVISCIPPYLHISFPAGEDYSKRYIHQYQEGLLEIKIESFSTFGNRCNQYSLELIVQASWKSNVKSLLIKPENLVVLFNGTEMNRNEEYSNNTVDTLSRSKFLLNQFFEIADNYDTDDNSREWPIDIVMQDVFRVGNSEITVDTIRAFERKMCDRESSTSAPRD